MELYNEIKNNYNDASTHLELVGLLDLGCIYCLCIYSVKCKNELYYTKKSLKCVNCGRESIIPIIPNSLLVKKFYTNKERLDAIQHLKSDMYPSSKL
jgi:hypothetical protein